MNLKKIFVFMMVLVAGTFIISVAPSFAQYLDTAWRGGTKDRESVVGQPQYLQLPWRCGDANADNLVNAFDVVYLANYIFGVGPAPDPVTRGNADSCGRTNIADVVYIWNYLAHFGSPPKGCTNTSDWCSDTSTVPGDTVRVGAQPYSIYPGEDSVAIPIYISNDVSLGGFSLGFHYALDSIEITSVSTVGSILPSGGSIGMVFKPELNQVLVGWYYGNTPIPAQTRGLLVTLNARILGGNPTQSIVLNSTFVSPAGDFIFVPADYGVSTFTVIHPVFIVPCSDFHPNPFGWQFSNSQNNMWPESWWQQFDYSGYPYNEYRGALNFWGAPACHHDFSCFAQVSDFPDWPLFVSVFGENQCYYDPPPDSVIFKPSAVERWVTIKDKWGGSMFGFVVSSLLFYSKNLDVATEFPGYDLLYQVPISDESRLLINKYQLYQFGKNQYHLLDSLRHDEPDTGLFHYSIYEAFDGIRSMLDAGCVNKFMILKNYDFTPLLALVPFRWEADHIDTVHRFNVYVYDPNYPGSEQPSVWYDFEWGLIPACFFWAWGYSNTLHAYCRGYTYLLDVNYFTMPPLLTTAITPAEGVTGKNGSGLSQYVAFYLRSADTVKFESSLGCIGQIGDSLLDTLVSDGIPIIPITGQDSTPIGYYLPNEAWSIQVSGITDSIFRLSLFTDSTVIVYSRDSVHSYDTEKIRYPGNDSTLWVHNPDPTQRSYGVEVISISPDSEVVCRVQDINISQNDSVRYSISSGSGLRVDNFGITTAYDIRVEIAGVNGDDIFFQEGITLPNNSSHLIVPDWRPYNDSLMILVDSGMVGSFSDTFFIENKGEYLRGDANGDWVINVSDVVYLINYLFINGPAPEPWQAGDVNCDGTINASDVVYLINYLFISGPPPAC